MVNLKFHALKRRFDLKKIFLNYESMKNRSFKLLNIFALLVSILLIAFCLLKSRTTRILNNEQNNEDILQNTDIEEEITTLRTLIDDIYEESKDVVKAADIYRLEGAQDRFKNVLSSLETMKEEMETMKEESFFHEIMDEIIYSLNYIIGEYNFIIEDNKDMPDNVRSLIEDVDSRSKKIIIYFDMKKNQKEIHKL